MVPSILIRKGTIIKDSEGELHEIVSPMRGRDEYELICWDVKRLKDGSRSTLTEQQAIELGDFVENRYIDVVIEQ